MTDESTPTTPSWSARLWAEAAGTFVLVFAVIGTALFSAGFENGHGGLGVGFLGVALALGLSVMASAFALGPVSGGHFNPAVTLGLAIAHRIEWRTVAPYVAAQIVGGAVASSVLALIAAGSPGGLAQARSGGFASVGWGELSPGGYSLGAAITVEVITTMIFVWVVLGATAKDGAGPLAPIAIGLTLTILALVAIPVSDASFNPARSIATAIWGGPVALSQLWMSVGAPLAGALVAGLTFNPLFQRRRALSSDAEPSA
jgi:aquaporin Z